MYSHPATISGQAHWWAGPLILPTAQGDRDQPQTPPPTPILLPFSRVGSTGAHSQVCHLELPTQGPVNKPLWEAWSVEAAGAAGGVEYLGG